MPQLRRLTPPESKKDVAPPSCCDHQISSIYFFHSLKIRRINTLGICRSFRRWVPFGWLRLRRGLRKRTFFRRFLPCRIFWKWFRTLFNKNWSFRRWRRSRLRSCWSLRKRCSQKRIRPWKPLESTKTSLFTKKGVTTTNKPPRTNPGQQLRPVFILSHTRINNPMRRCLYSAQYGYDVQHIFKVLCHAGRTLGSAGNIIYIFCLLWLCPCMAKKKYRFKLPIQGWGYLFALNVSPSNVFPLNLCRPVWALHGCSTIPVIYFTIDRKKYCLL